MVRFVIKKLEKFIGKSFELAGDLTKEVAPLLNTLEKGAFASEDYFQMIKRATLQEVEFAEDGWFGKKNLDEIKQSIQQIAEQVSTPDLLKDNPSEIYSLTSSSDEGQ